MGARAGAGAGDWVREKGSEFLMSGGRKALDAVGDKFKSDSLLAGLITAAATGGNAFKGAGMAAGAYTAGRATKYGAKKLEEFGRREIDRVLALPEHYRGPLTEAMANGGGEKALGAMIFVLQQRDPQFRESWKATGSQE